MLRKVVKAVTASGGRQRDIVLPAAVLSPSECTFGFDPNVVVSRNYKLHNPEAPERLECNVPTGEGVGNVPRQDESVWGKSFCFFHQIRQELTIMSCDVDMQIRREGNSHQNCLLESMIAASIDARISTYLTLCQCLFVRKSECFAWYPDPRFARFPG